ncbi:MAG: hypothetical protein ACRDSJ_23035 [Rubrobacteraceae bacterium]
MAPPKSKVRVFTALLFVSGTVAVVSAMLVLGGGKITALAVGLLVGATAAVEVGWFGGRAFFSKEEER